MLTPVDQCRGEPGDGPGQVGETVPEPLEVAGQSRERAGAVPCGIEFVQVPAEPVDGPGALGEQVLAVVDEQPEAPGIPSSPMTQRGGAPMVLGCSAPEQYGAKRTSTRVRSARVLELMLRPLPCPAWP